MTTTTRRRLVRGSALLAVSLLALPTGHAQQSAPVRRIGYLAGSSAASGLHDAFRQGLRALGWVEGRTVAIDFRFADGRYERLPDLAAELVRLQVDVIVALSTAAAVAARNATATIPIVMVNAGDPVRLRTYPWIRRPRPCGL